ncbi:MAG: AI-2E family transporter [Candidatus Wildermuthbacteria bacterium]|nr:AI-2E family transporter [Candidatus Wildermuthbacteria bacterium]
MSNTQIQTYFLLFLLLGILALVFAILLPFLSVLLIAASLAIVFHPLHAKILALWRGRATLAAFTSVLAILVLILMPLSLLGFVIFQEAAGFYSAAAEGRLDLEPIEKIVGNIESQIQKFVPTFSLEPSAYAEQLGKWLMQNIGGAFSKATQLILYTFLMLLSLYYFLKEGDQFKKIIVTFSPFPDEYDIEIFSRLRAVISSVIKGSLVIAIIQGVFTGIGFLAFGVPAPALWGAVAAIAALIPTLGASIITLLGAGFLFMSGHTLAAIGLALWGTLLVGLVDNILQPRLVQRGTALHPFLIFLSVIGGISFFGIMGFLLGPIILSLLKALFDVYQKQFRSLIKTNEFVIKTTPKHD